MKNHEKSASGQVTYVEAGTGHEGQRIDNFLVTQLKGVPKSHLYRILRKGEIRVNKKRVKPDYRLQVGDVVRVPPIRTASPEQPERIGDRILERINQSILYEDKDLLIINKPAGLAVHGGSGVSYGLIEALRALRPEAPFLELVHRLDRDTSGCLVVAKRRSALRALHEMLREGHVEKHYLALLKGRIGRKRTVDVPLLKNVLSSGERVVKVHETEGKAALSVFQPCGHYADATLVDVHLLTGRTHQIRVHAAHIGHPIAGDDKYGDEEYNRTVRERAGLRRLFLHARSLAFSLPGRTDPIAVKAPLSDELEAVLQRLAMKQE